MKILCIASILPVPGKYPENDAIFRLYHHYLDDFDTDQVECWRPSAYSNAMLAVMSTKWKMYHQVLKQGDYEYNSLPVKLLPFADKKGSPALLANLARTLWFFNVRKIKQRIRNFNPDIVHAHWLYPEGALARSLKKKYNLPYIITLRRETAFLSSSATHSDALDILNQSEAVIVLNIRMKAQLRKAGFRGTVHMIPHGIEDMFFNHQAKPDRQREKGPALLTISRMLDWKYLDRLLQALSILAEDYPFTYTLVGDGPEKERLTDLIDQLGLNDRVTIKAPVPYESVPELLAEHDLFALTSFPETFGRVYFEAMACGLPIICSQNSGVDGYFKNGEAGFFADHSDISDIAAQTGKLLSNPVLRKKMGSAARNFVSSYRWPEITRSMNILYKQSLKSTS